MPGLPFTLPVRDEEDATTTNPVRYCNHSRIANQMCRQGSCSLSAEEASAAEETLSVYCKPVEFYNILQRRAVRNPSFLQRSLHYKIEAKRNKRIQMTISLSESVNSGVQVQKILPLYVLLARPVFDVAAGGHSAGYCLTRAPILTSSSEFERRDRHEANLVLPEINKLSAEIKSSKLTLLLVSCGDRKSSLCGWNHIMDRVDTSPLSTVGYCLWGEIPLESLNLSPEKCISLSSARGAEMLSTVDMHSCFLEPSSLDVGSFISLKTPGNPVTMQVQVRILAQEVGAKESSPYNSYTFNNIPNSSLSHIMRLRFGNVLFNYKYYNNRLQKTEVTENFICSFCLVACASFKGLRCHLSACHDLFNYEFLVTEEHQSVNVSVKSPTWISEVADGFDPRLETFFLCPKPQKRRRPQNISRNTKHVRPHVVRSGSLEVPREGFLEKEDGASSVPMPSIRSPLDTMPLNKIPPRRYQNGAHFSKEAEKASNDFPRENDLQKNRHTESNGTEDLFVAESMERVASSPNVPGTCTAIAVGPECFHQESGSNAVPPAMLQFAKTRKLSIDRSDPRNRILLQKRQFFHSHRAQPMAMEQVLSDRDSEDEVDDDIADLEDRRMLDDFVDVTKDEKRIMHLWNSFVRKQRVLADGHISWACEAFSRLHAPDLVQSPALMWCWRLVMIKLWNQSLMDAHTMDNCSKIIQLYEQESLDPK